MPGSGIIAKMTLVQRGTAIFQALREYAPVTNILALIILPIAIFPTQSDEFATILSRHDQSWLRTIFLVAFISSKANNIFVHAHIGMQRLVNFQSCDIWCAPCKSSIMVQRHRPKSGNVAIHWLHKLGINRHCYALHHLSFPNISRYAYLWIQRLHRLRCERALAPTPRTTPLASFYPWSCPLFHLHPIRFHPATPPPSCHAKVSISRRAFQTARCRLQNLRTAAVHAISTHGTRERRFTLCG